MANRWRRRQLCVLLGPVDVPASMRTVTGSAILLDTPARPPIGEAVTLRHPHAGTVTGQVEAHHADGIALRLGGTERDVAFAVAAIAADMSRPA